MDGLKGPVEGTGMSPRPCEALRTPSISPYIVYRTQAGDLVWPAGGPSSQQVTEVGDLARPVEGPSRSPTSVISRGQFEALAGHRSPRSLTLRGSHPRNSVLRHSAHEVFQPILPQTFSQLWPRICLNLRWPGPFRLRHLHNSELRDAMREVVWPVLPETSSQLWASRCRARRRAARLA